MSHTLLLADDSTTIQRVVELTFANEDIDVVTVGDGAQAIEVIQRDAPDIVLADVSMPGKDGYEVASFIRSDPARARIPVVLLTGAFEPLDESRCDAIGRHEVIVKPFEPREMIGKVRELLGRPAGRPSVPEAVEVAETVVADAPEAAVPDAPAAETEAAEAVVPDVSPAADAEAAPVGVPVAMPSEPAGGACRRAGRRFVRACRGTGRRFVRAGGGACRGGGRRLVRGDDGACRGAGRRFV